jgi:CheY-like chemotaxis protein
MLTRNRVAALTRYSGGIVGASPSGRKLWRMARTVARMDYGTIAQPPAHVSAEIRLGRRPIFQVKDLGLCLDIGARYLAETLRPMYSIVVYEADDLMRGLLQEWLTGAGYRVSALAPCGRPPQVAADLVIVSIGMPKHTGLRSADEIRAAHPGTPIIAISAQFRADLSTAGTTARTLGVAQVIAKPLSRDALLAAVSAIIDPATERVCDE